MKIRILVILCLFALYACKKKSESKISEPSTVEQEQKEPVPALKFANTSAFLFTYRTKGTETIETNPVEMSNCQDDLPSEFIVSPGYYKLYMECYHFDEPGLYRFVDADQKATQRLVGSSDWRDIASAMAWVQTHGARDNALSYDELLELAKGDKLLLTCGNISKFFVSLLRTFGIRSRVVHSLTLDEWNSYDNGHTMLEVMNDDGTWVLLDVDMNRTFAIAGEEINLLRFSRSISLDNVDFNFIANDTNNNVSYYNPLIERIFGSEKRWYKRIGQVPIICDVTDCFFTAAEENVQRVQEYYANTLEYLNSKDFEARLYTSYLKK
ncbi:MAG: transglutaminase domain-containing protein [Pseudobacteriovorax sp.]|nr:transglutaminase domain-containing protein [Pseudobacteriovorax sp.]